ncbi:MAG: hypothetical protein JWQ32_3450 [Marmoricola sp.]|nr:hypothetical protein [Marmoricola sp.]
MKAKRLVLLAVASSSVLTLSGCAQSGSSAAQVGGDTVSTSDVSFLTRMQCDALDRAAKDPAQASQVQALPTRLVQADMVNALVQAQLNHQLALKLGTAYDRATYRSVMDQFEPVVLKAPAADQARFRDLVGSFYRGQLQVYAIATRLLAAQGLTQPTQNQLQSAVGSLQDAMRKKTSVKINPVYGPDKNGAAGAVDPSLSVAVSSFAKQSSAATPPASYIASLPSNQKCG